MTATTGSDASGPVEYYFDETSGNSGGSDSSWTTNPVYSDTGLTPDTEYTYTVQMRDSVPNTGAASTPANATTPDNTPPTPDPMQWSVEPYHASDTPSITMVATEASDPKDVEYYFECYLGGGADSAWQTSRIYTDINLSDGTTYRYRVKARDKSTNQNETGWSSSPSATVNLDYSTPKGIAEPVTGDLGNDLANFSVNPFTGAATYTIPIVIPPARGGSKPSISLNYGGGGNSWCGVGWSLGMGAIQRDTTDGVPVKLNGEDFDDEYDDAKGFVVNFAGVNSKLVNVGGSVYRAETDQAFLKFELNVSQKKWTATDKSGNKYYFGQTSAARMIHPDFSSTGIKKIFLWALEKTEDINGNLTWIDYTTDAGQLYLSKIWYNGNSNDTSLNGKTEAPCTVEFGLDPVDRDDKSISYKTGFRVETNKRLKSIAMKVDGTDVRRYELEYTDSSSTLRSLLTTVREFTYGDGAPPGGAELPQLVFDYQQKTFEFEEAIVWGPLNNQGHTYIPGWNSPYATDGYQDAYATMLDINGDGLPDRVMRKDYGYDDGPTVFVVQINNGAGFEPEMDWEPVNSEINAWNKPRFICTSSPCDGGNVEVDIFDIDGDGLPDRVMRKYSAPVDRFRVQINNGTGFDNLADWGYPLDDASSYTKYRRIHAGDDKSDNITTMLDINGDGLPDRVLRKTSSPYDYFRVQINNGTGLESAINWGPVTGQGAVIKEWYSAFGVDEDVYSDTTVTMLDINGDGLPDRVMRKASAPRDWFVVQFNTGFGFADEEPWKALDDPTLRNIWTYPRVSGENSGNDVGDTDVDFFDINGDGLPDRIMCDPDIFAPYNVWPVQLNTGDGFERDVSDDPIVRNWTINWDSTDNDKKNDKRWNLPHTVEDYSGQTLTYVTMLDINGDGLADRLIRYGNTGSGYTLKAQLNKGPFPDLLSKVTGRLGGEVEVAYEPSTRYDNQDDTGVSRLPFPVHTVSSVTVKAGLTGFGSDSITSYDYSRGFYNSARREFGGFGRVEVTDPLDTKTVSFFHQGGGYNDDANGEFEDEDTGGFAKKGMPYRNETWGWNETAGAYRLYNVTVNKVDLAEPDTGRYFPYVVQTVVMDFEGTVDDMGPYRARAKAFEYFTTTGNIKKLTDFAEVLNVNVANHTFTNSSTSDDLYTHATYANFSGNPDIIDKIDTLWTSSDSAGNNTLSETIFGYDNSDCGYSDDRGNVTEEWDWLDKEDGATADRHTLTLYLYDKYGNLRVAKDQINVTTTTEYDADYKTFPIRMVQGKGTINYSTFRFTNETGKFITSATYDERSGQVSSTTNVMDIDTEYTYDEFYRLTDIDRAIEPGGSAATGLWVTDIQYNLGGVGGGSSQNWVHQRFNGYDAYIYNDGIGRVVQVRVKAETGAAYRVTNASYDERGSVVYETLPFFEDDSDVTLWDGSKLKTTTGYDEIGRISSVTPPLGDTDSPTGPVTTAYKDGTNLWVNVITDAEDKVKKQHFDARGNVITLKEKIGASTYYVTDFAYDRLSRLLTITDHADNVTTYEYDSLDRKVESDDPDMGVWSHVYDDAGNLVKQTDAEGHILAFTYSTDEIGRLTQRKIYDSVANYPGSPVATITYTYDTSGDPAYTVYQGLLYKVEDQQGWTKMGYDSRGRAVKTTRYLSENDQAYTTGGAFDDADRVRQLAYPGDSAIIRYDYDSAGHLVTVESIFGTGTVETFYDAHGFNALEQLEGVDYGNGVTTEYEFYTNSKRRKRIYTYKGAATRQDTSYKYDKVANLTEITDDKYTLSASSTFNSIQYDDLHRLTSLYSVGMGATITYEYTSIGNVNKNKEFGTGTYVYGGSQPHAVTSANGKNYSYDDCGNMITRGSQILTYDEENQLKLVDLDGDWTDDIEFGYDESGNRLWSKDIYTSQLFQIWIGDIYEEKDGKVLCHVLTDDGLVTTFEPEPVVDPVFYYYHNDHLGSSTIMTDRSGNLVKHYGYKAYGNERYNNPVENFDVSNRFTGQILDEDPGLYYYGSRFYDAELARFIQADPAFAGNISQDSQALNRYSYTLNNPLKFTDPSGNVPVDLEDSTDDHITEASDFEVIKTSEMLSGQNSAFDAGATAAQGSKSSFHGQGTGTDTNGGSGAGTVSGSKAPSGSENQEKESQKAGKPPSGIPSPPEHGPGWDWTPTRDRKGKGYFKDPKGGKWRYHPEDKRHNPHWDHIPPEGKKQRRVPIGNMPPLKPRPHRIVETIKTVRDSAVNVAKTVGKEAVATGEWVREHPGKTGVIIVGTGIIVFDIATLPSGEGAAGVVMIKQALAP
jgi:RHS repeat-associated protein